MLGLLDGLGSEFDVNGRDAVADGVLSEVMLVLK
jgi:hypothetical protein